MVIKVGVGCQVLTKVVENSGTVGDGELEGVLRDCMLNNSFKFHRSKERKEILITYKLGLLYVIIGVRYGAVD
jgi:hypothetical protein